VQESAAAGRGGGGVGVMGVIGTGGGGGAGGGDVPVAAEEGGAPLGGVGGGVLDGFFVAGGEEGHFDFDNLIQIKVYLGMI